ncbi:MAG TPA: amidase [Cyclobacteriaceae bacterium]|jgi:amidase|nr:amidase [Cyclobacteriaceae bacterium]
MKRRNFIQRVALAGTLFPVFSSSAFSLEKKEDLDVNLTDDFTLNEVTIDELQQKMKSRAMTSRSITQMYLKRIDSIDKSGPTINSVIEVNPDALVIADAMDAERKVGKVRGPLHGIPILIKDNIDTADKMMNTAGSIALEGNLPSTDAFITKKLREAGAVILGKTNPSEWANFRSSRSASGWSSRGGQTRNPYVIDRNPSGSSSGSGAAVSANLATISIGTETDGSIVSPSSNCGVVGLKPTVGLWSRSGIIPISHTQDTAGPMTRTVKDAAILLGALVGVDELDIATKKSVGKFENDYTKFLDKGGLRGKRLGVEKSYFKGRHEAVNALLKEAVDLFRKQGAEVIEVDFLDLAKDVGKNEGLVLSYEFKEDLNKYLSKANGKVKSLKELIEFNKQNEAKAMPWFKQERLEESEARGDLASKEYVDALDRMLTLARNAINKTMDDHRLDAICGTSNGPSAPIDWVNGDRFTGYGLSGPAATAGYPHITVPMGFVMGLPIGLSFVGREFGEGALITIAYGYEQASLKRKPPEFRKSVLE